MGRQDPLTICFIPTGLSMGADQAVDVQRVLGSVGELAALGVDWVTVALGGDTRDAQLAALEAFGREVIATADR